RPDDLRRRPRGGNPYHPYLDLRPGTRLSMSMPDVPPAPPPSPAAGLPQVRLKIAPRSSHPWVFQKMVERPATRLPPGGVGEVRARGGRWAGGGLHTGPSRTARRVRPPAPAEPIDAEFTARRIARAVALRRDWLGLDAVTDAYRLVHSEGDGLSGLVVDRFGLTPVLEVFPAGLYRFRDAVCDAPPAHYPDRPFYWFPPA